jgi:hypothetical protein
MAGVLRQGPEVDCLKISYRGDNLMEQIEVKEIQASDVKSLPSVAPSTGHTRATLFPQTEGGTCGCANAASNGVGTATLSYIYAIGKLETRFPRVSVEKELAQATGRTEATGLSDRQALHAVLSGRPNRYLARQLCWVLTIQGLETYMLQPRDPADIDLLLEALRPAPSSADVDVIIGVKGPIASPEMCNGLMIPIVAFDQIYSFDTGILIKSIPRPDTMPADKFEPAAQELFTRMMQMTDNAGSMDEHRG